LKFFQFFAARAIQCQGSAVFSETNDGILSPPHQLQPGSDPLVPHRSEVNKENPMSKLRSAVGLVLSLLIAVPPGAFASSHREAPITALDHTADITDFYAFVSYDHPDRVTFIMNVDPFLQPSNGPNYFPFDPSIVYQIKIDNNHNAKENIVFTFRFHTNILAPGVFTGFVGAGGGIDAPSNSPKPVAPGTPIVPPAITSLTGAGAAGLSLQQTFTVEMTKGDQTIPLTNTNSSPLIAVPSNVGPRTMPDYDALAAQGIYDLRGLDGASDIRVFAGTVADPFFIDLGAAFDSFNFRTSAGGGVLTTAQDADNYLNLAPNSVAGFNVNTIAIEVPIVLLTSDGALHPATDPRGTIGAWATTSRQEISIRTFAFEAENRDHLAQVQRLGNPLVNELVIGTGSKDRWSMSKPEFDSQFASYDLDPLLARVFNAVYGINIPAPPRTDLLPLVTYAPPIAPSGTPAGPIADMLRLNTGVPPTPLAKRSRLGLIAGDAAGFPNGRRLTDDVVDIAARVVGGGILSPGFDVAPNNLIGDGVNAPDVPPQETFPYVHYAYSGRDSRHISPGASTGCGDQPNPSSAQNGDAPPLNQGGSAPCPVN
jgi:hypothetical protein